MSDLGESWQARAFAKREAILTSIPQQWRIKGQIPSAREQEDVTGRFINEYLTEREKEITEADAVGIIENTSVGQWTAVEVTLAFCHRASIAHQLVPCASALDTRY